MHFVRKKSRKKILGVKMYGLTDLKLYVTTFSPHLAYKI